MGKTQLKKKMGKTVWLYADEKDPVDWKIDVMAERRLAGGCPTVSKVRSYCWTSNTLCITLFLPASHLMCTLCVVGFMHLGGFSRSFLRVSTFHTLSFKWLIPIFKTIATNALLECHPPGKRFSDASVWFGWVSSVPLSFYFSDSTYHNTP